jgi:hypothetical protein
MILPLTIIIASWILILSVVVGLCLSARQGDHQLLMDTPAHPASELTAPSLISPRTTAEPTMIPARITAQSAQPATRAYPCNPFGITGSTAG